MQDLIHGAPVGKPVATKAHVTAVYIDEDSGEETLFTRGISGSSSEWRLNGKVSSLQLGDNFSYTLVTGVMPPSLH